MGGDNLKDKTLQSYLME